jgi:hypothetical protein
MVMTERKREREKGIHRASFSSLQGKVRGNKWMSIGNHGVSLMQCAVTRLGIGTRGSSTVLLFTSWVICFSYLFW